MQTGNLLHVHGTYFVFLKNSLCHMMTLMNVWSMDHVSLPSIINERIEVKSCILILLLYLLFTLNYSFNPTDCSKVSVSVGIAGFISTFETKIWISIYFITVHMLIWFVFGALSLTGINKGSFSIYFGSWAYTRETTIVKERCHVFHHNSGRVRGPRRR